MLVDEIACESPGHRRGSAGAFVRVVHSGKTVALIISRPSGNTLELRRVDPDAPGCRPWGRTRVVVTFGDRTARRNRTARRVFRPLRAGTAGGRSRNHNRNSRVRHCRGRHVVRLLPDPRTKAAAASVPVESARCRSWRGSTHFGQRVRSRFRRVGCGDTGGDGEHRSRTDPGSAQGVGGRRMVGRRPRGLPPFRAHPAPRRRW